MSDGDLKSQWQRLPTAAKLICGGAAALVGLAMIGALAGDDADYADAEGAPAGYAAQPGYYGGGQGQAQGYAGGGYAGYTACPSADLCCHSSHRSTRQAHTYAAPNAYAGRQHRRAGRLVFGLCR